MTALEPHSTLWCLVCPIHGHVALTAEEFNRRIDPSNDLGVLDGDQLAAVARQVNFTCPICTAEAQWDEEHFRQVSKRDITSIDTPELLEPWHWKLTVEGDLYAATAYLPSDRDFSKPICGWQLLLGHDEEPMLEPTGNGAWPSESEIVQSLYGALLLRSVLP